MLLLALLRETRGDEGTVEGQGLRLHRLQPAFMSRAERARDVYTVGGRFQRRTPSLGALLPIARRIGFFRFRDCLSFLGPAYTPAPTISCLTNVRKLLQTVAPV